MLPTFLHAVQYDMGLAHYPSFDNNDEQFHCALRGEHFSKNVAELEWIRGCYMVACIEQLVLDLSWQGEQR